MSADVRELKKGAPATADAPESQEASERAWHDRPIQDLVAEHPRLLLVLLVLMAIPYFLTCLGISIVFLTGGTCG